MKSLRLPILVLAAALPATAAPAADGPAPGWMEILLMWFLGVAPLETAGIVGSGEASTADPATTDTPDGNAPDAPLAESSSDTESGHLIDPNG